MIVIMTIMTMISLKLHFKMLFLHMEVISDDDHGQCNPMDDIRPDIIPDIIYRYHSRYQTEYQVLYSELPHFIVWLMVSFGSDIRQSIF